MIYLIKKCIFIVAFSHYNAFNKRIAENPKSMTKDLLYNLKKGNRKAQEAFYKQYAPLLFNIAFRYVSNEQDAGSIVNYAFYKIFKHLKTFKYNGEASLISWLKKIVINEALMQLRSKTIFKELTESISEVQIEIQNTQNKLDAEIYLMLINQLPNDLSTVFNLYAIDGFSHKEIAEKLSIKESSSRTYLTRARKILQKKLEDLK